MQRRSCSAGNLALSATVHSGRREAGLRRRSLLLYGVRIEFAPLWIVDIAFRISNFPQFNSKVAYSKMEDPANQLTAVPSQKAQKSFRISQKESTEGRVRTCDLRCVRATP